MITAIYERLRKWRNISARTQPRLCPQQLQLFAVQLLLFPQKKLNLPVAEAFSNQWITRQMLLLPMHDWKRMWHWSGPASIAICKECGVAGEIPRDNFGMRRYCFGEGAIVLTAGL